MHSMHLLHLYNRAGTFASEYMEEFQGKILRAISGYCPEYPDITLEGGQYKIYCPAKAFDPPTQSGIYTISIV